MKFADSIDPEGVYGSLTLGGYDASRFVPNNVLFHLQGDISRDLVVGLQSISSTDVTGSKTTLLPSSIATFIDSTWPYINLPSEACRLFEETFDLYWDSSINMYTINDTIHEILLARNPKFTFTIEDITGGDVANGGATVDVVLPYVSFDLVATFPRVNSTTRYFPIQPAKNATQYTLGRTFLQEA